ncbi:unnamed protein product [Ambrosiozyma monospora]|uniref:Unnamed protein product n=1 Tax=Ambrosiozyma monospora TaxID=43982 RepID=A0A9W7DDA6_AMBMO|nr:unnamed protein product [Ambrosiozyma monospora]
MRLTNGRPAGGRGTTRRTSSVATTPASRSRSRPSSSLSSRREMNKTTTHSDSKKARQKTSSALNNESIQVVVRCRGRNEAEVKQKAPVIVKPVGNGTKKQICIETSSPHDFHTLSSISTSTKTYTVDRVFGPDSEQSEIFEKTALPLFNDFVKGYNCTMLAYGQTGSGKTYTMCGGVDFENNADIPSDAGVIPRVLCELFKRVEKDSWHVHCSFVEVYNEELSDLLTDPKLHSKKLRIYDDRIPAAGGQTLTSIKIDGLSEIEVKSTQEGLALLQKGTHQRKTASTNMNTRSSRSHSIFIISLMKKEKNGEYTFSRMNLVDLAGSEDIIRSGATDQRAKEAGSINQSLLTLGKVINSLVEGSSHIPYRDSKLTHLLRDSLGGNTKTILVANVSSTLLDLQTTTSTLEYASKAKNVQNSAQIGPLVSERNIVSRLIEENNRLKKDLKANKLKDGVYLDEENYHKLMMDFKSLATELEESKRINESLENKLDAQTKKVDSERQEKLSIQQALMDTETEVVKIQNRLNDEQSVNIELKQSLDELVEKCEVEIETKRKLHKDILDFLTTNLSATRVLTRLVHEFEELVDLPELIEDTSEVINKMKNFTNNQQKIEGILSKRIQELSIFDSKTVTSIESFKKMIKSSSNLIEERIAKDAEFHKFLTTELLQSKNVKSIKTSLAAYDQQKVQELIEKKIAPAVHDLVKSSLSHHIDSFIDNVGSNLIEASDKWNKQSSAQMESLEKCQTGYSDFLEQTLQSTKAAVIHPLMETFKSVGSTTVDNLNALDELSKEVESIQSKQREIIVYNNEQSSQKKQVVGLVDQLHHLCSEKSAELGNIEFGVNANIDQGNMSNVNATPNRQKMQNSQKNNDFMTTETVETAKFDNAAINDGHEIHNEDNDDNETDLRYQEMDNVPPSPKKLHNEADDSDEVELVLDLTKAPSKLQYRNEYMSTFLKNEDLPSNGSQQQDRQSQLLRSKSRSNSIPSATSMVTSKNSISNNRSFSDGSLIPVLSESPAKRHVANLHSRYKNYVGTKSKKGAHAGPLRPISIPSDNLFLFNECKNGLKEGSRTFSHGSVVKAGRPGSPLKKVAAVRRKREVDEVTKDDEDNSDNGGLLVIKRARH